MKPLNYAIMKYVDSVTEASAEDVIKALSPEYGRYKMLRPDAVEEALMVAKANALLDESRFELDENGELRVFYKVNEYGHYMIEKFIRD